MKTKLIKQLYDRIRRVYFICHENVFLDLFFIMARHAIIFLTFLGNFPQKIQ